MDERSERIKKFGTCEECGAPRDAVLEDDELVLMCENGHRS